MKKGCEPFSRSLLPPQGPKHSANNNAAGHHSPGYSPETMPEATIS